MKKRFLSLAMVFALVLTLVPAVAMYADEYIAEDEEAVEVFPGIAYLDPMFGMAVVINNPDWTFYRDANFDELYFFNHVTPSASGLIRLSAFPFTGDVEQEIARIWEEMLDIHNNQPNSFVYHDAQAVQVGAGEYHGYLFPLEAQLYDFMLVANALIWSAGDMMYIITTSAMDYNAEEVQGVLDGIMDSFISLDWQAIEDGTATFWEGTEVVPLMDYITAMGGEYVEMETPFGIRIIFILGGRMMLITLEDDEYAINDLSVSGNGFELGETISRFLDAPPVVRDGDVYFPFANFLYIFQQELYELANP